MLWKFLMWNLETSHACLSCNTWNLSWSCVTRSVTDHCVWFLQGERGPPGPSGRQGTQGCAGIKGPKVQTETPSTDCSVSLALNAAHGAVSVVRKLSAHEHRAVHDRANSYKGTALAHHFWGDNMPTLLNLTNGRSSYSSSIRKPKRSSLIVEVIMQCRGKGCIWWEKGTEFHVSYKEIHRKLQQNTRNFCCFPCVGCKR